MKDKAYKDATKSEQVYMGNSSSSTLTSKGKVFFKLNSDKTTLALNNISYVPSLPL